MSVMGLVLLPREREYVGTNVRALLELRTEPAPVEKPVVPRASIQDHLRAKMQDAAGEIEGLFDDMVRAGRRFSDSQRAMNLLRERNVAPQMVSEIADH